MRAGFWTQTAAQSQGNAGVQRYELGRIYSALRRAMAAGDVADAAHLLGRALGLPLAGSEILSHLPEAASKLRPQLTYRGWKPAELAMLRHGVKPLVKFEDIALSAARAAQWPEGVRVAASAPYVRDDLLLRGRPVAATDPAALVSLYASRDDRGVRLRDLERTHPEDIRGAAELLSIPQCCAAAFAEAFDHSRRDQDDLNDEAAWRLLRSAGGSAPWLTNPLSDLELLGFYPCRLDCPLALERAGRVAALLQHDAVELAELTRPVVFWRMPFFVVLPRQDEWQPGRPLQLTGWQVNAFADPAARRAQTLMAAQWLAWTRHPTLGEADQLWVSDSALRFAREGVTLREVPVSTSRPPALVWWSGAPPPDRTSPPVNLLASSGN